MFMPDIYWLDGIKTKQFLEMLVDDLLTEYSLTEGSSKAKGVEVGGNIQKLLAKYRSDKSESIQREGTISRSNTALMKDLYTILDENGSIQHLEGFDDDIVSQLRNGEFIELEGEVTQSPAQLVFSSIMDFAEQHKQLFLTDEDDTKQFETVSTMLKFKKVTLLINPYVDSNYTFFTSIDTKNFVQDKYDLDGEFSVLARVRKIYKPHQSVDLIKMLPGKMKIGKKQMLDMLSSLKLAGDDISFDVDEIDESSFEINGPAIELTPIAIYQK